MDILGSVGGSFAVVLSLLLASYWMVHKVTQWQCEMNNAKNTSKLESNIDAIKADIIHIKDTLDILMREVDKK